MFLIDFISSEKDEEFICHMTSIAQGSEHPLSEAVVNFASMKNIKSDPCHGLEALPGKGIRGNVNGREVMMGSFNWFTELEIIIPENSNERNHSYRSKKARENN